MPTAYVTCPSAESAELARTLLQERLAACVNRFECQSTYRWDDEVVDEAEDAMVIKTTSDRYDDLVERIVELHPHDVPCVERFDETDVISAYASWVEDTVKQ